MLGGFCDSGLVSPCCDVLPLLFSPSSCVGVDSDIVGQTLLILSLE